MPFADQEADKHSSIRTSEWFGSRMYGEHFREDMKKREEKRVRGKHFDLVLTIDFHIATGHREMICSQDFSNSIWFCLIELITILLSKTTLRDIGNPS